MFEIAAAKLELRGGKSEKINAFANEVIKDMAGARANSRQERAEKA